MERQKNVTQLADEADYEAQRAELGTGNWEKAARLYREAAGACLGNKRADRLYQAADDCAARAKRAL